MENRKMRDDMDSLIAFIRQSHKEFWMERLLPLGIKTSSRGMVLYVVYEHEGLVQDDISSRLSMDKAFVTRELNALNEMGLIDRRKDPKDHRRNHIFLTDKGYQIGEAIVNIEEEWVAMAYNGVTPRMFEEMKKFTERVAANIKNA